MKLIVAVEVAGRISDDAAGASKIADDDRLRVDRLNGNIEGGRHWLRWSTQATFGGKGDATGADEAARAEACGRAAVVPGEDVRRA